MRPAGTVAVIGSGHEIAPVFALNVIWGVGIWILFQTAWAVTSAVRASVQTKSVAPLGPVVAHRENLLVENHG